MVQARRLMAKDLFTLARIVRACRADVERAIRETRAVTLAPLGSLGGDEPLPALATPETDWVQLGTTVLFGLLEQADGGIRSWLADMAGLKPAQFDELPLGELLALVEQVVGQEDWPGFLGRLSAIFASSTARAT